VLDGEVPLDDLDHFFLPFEVPAGTVEIEIRHDDQSDVNVLDWGLNDPEGFRGWGGGNAEPAIVGLDAASRSYLPGPIAPGTWNVVVGKVKVDESPATYHVEIVFRDTPTLPPQPEREPYAPTLSDLVPIVYVRLAEWVEGGKGEGIVARSELKPILNRDRQAISQEAESMIQETLDNYGAGVNVVRVNFNDADPPKAVIDAFRDVEAASQDRDTEERRAEAYANQKLAAARGEAAQVQQEAESYRAQVVNEAKGEAARFESIYEEYQKAPAVTRKRLYLETIEKVLGDVDKVIIDEKAGGGQGVVPYLPLNDMVNKGKAPAGGSN